MKISVLLVGESWQMQIVETKGADTFSYSTYEVGTAYIEAALSTDEIAFTHMPCHMVQEQFPDTAEELKNKYDCVIISDCGANTFLLPAKTFLQHEPTPNKLEILKKYVEIGGGLCMAGGYMSFMGIEGKGRYNDTPVEAALPVNFQKNDDRVELPQGVEMQLDPRKHKIFEGLGKSLPRILGYNRAAGVKDSAEVILEYNGDPVISVMEYGKGRSIGYAMDVAPHWCPKEFCESKIYKTLWTNIVKWLAQKA